MKIFNGKFPPNILRFVEDAIYSNSDHIRSNDKLDSCVPSCCNVSTFIHHTVIVAFVFLLLIRVRQKPRVYKN